MKRHIVILLLLTLVIQSWMFVSYPMGGVDDNQSGQRFLIDRLVSGDLLIGNLRFNTGYPLVIAPVVAVSRMFPRIDDRILLLVQVGLSATIPFLVYDIIRRRRTPNEAFIVALFVLLDPFGLQWSHFSLPEWLIAFLLVAALWLLNYALLTKRRLLLYTLLSGLLLGIAVLARVNFAPVVAALGLMFFAITSISFWKRFQMFFILGVSSLAVLFLYLVLIQYPSTGTFRLSCIGSLSLNEGLDVNDIPLQATDGPASQEYLRLTSMSVPEHALFLSDTYPRWSMSGAWASPEEQALFLEQGFTGENLPFANRFDLIYYMGACPTDDLLRDVYFERIRRYPLEWLSRGLKDTLLILIQSTEENPTLYLPTYDSLVRNTNESFLGFERVEGDFYTGQWVWTPGIWLYSTIFHIWNAIKWLTPIALVWALLSRNWFYATCAVLLLAVAGIMPLMKAPEARLYSQVYPLWTILLGGMLASFIKWARKPRLQQ